jgi:hypothetical protein
MLDEARIKRFKELYWRRFNEELSFEEARRRAERLRRIVHITYRAPPPKQK